MPNSKKTHVLKNLSKSWTSSVAPGINSDTESFANSPSAIALPKFLDFVKPIGGSRSSSIWNISPRKQKKSKISDTLDQIRSLLVPQRPTELVAAVKGVFPQACGPFDIEGLVNEIQVDCHVSCYDTDIYFFYGDFTDVVHEPWHFDTFLLDMTAVIVRKSIIVFIQYKTPLFLVKERLATEIFRFPNDAPPVLLYLLGNIDASIHVRFNEFFSQFRAIIIEC